MRHRTALAEARRRGRAAGNARASWLIDGNTTTDTLRALARCAQGCETAHDESVRPWVPDWLSGEYASESIPELLGDILPEGGDPAQQSDAGYDKCRDIEDAYCAAATDAFEARWQRDVHRALGDKAWRTARQYVHDVRHVALWERVR